MKKNYFAVLDSVPGHTEHLDQVSGFVHSVCGHPGMGIRVEIGDSGNSADVDDGSDDDPGEKVQLLTNKKTTSSLAQF